MTHTPHPTRVIAAVGETRDADRGDAVARTQRRGARPRAETGERLARGAVRPDPTAARKHPFIFIGRSP